MYEVHRITLTVLVNRDEEDRPDRWDWHSMTESWAVPYGRSEVVASFKTADDFYDSLDSPAPTPKEG